MPEQIPIPLSFNSVRSLLLDVCKQAIDAAAYVQSMPQGLALSEHPQYLGHYLYLHNMLITMQADCLRWLAIFTICSKSVIARYPVLLINKSFARARFARSRDRGQGRVPTLGNSYHFHQACIFSACSCNQ